MTKEEPVAYFDPQKGGFYWAKPTKIEAPVTVDVEPLPLYTTPQTKGCDECGVGGGYALYCLACAEKYVKPEWVGLTDEEYFRLQMKVKTPMISVQDYIDAMRMVEAKLKEKNK